MLHFERKGSNETERKKEERDSVDNISGSVVVVVVVVPLMKRWLVVYSLL